MRWIISLFGLLICITSTLNADPLPIDTFLVLTSGDTDLFWAQIPEGYDPDSPPAILIWWHQLGGTQYEMRDYTDYDDLANQHGWIAASHFGPNDRHWNTQKAQYHCRAMLDWLSENYPFSRDSIYMIGGSMGGAAGQVWHNNNCGSNDYLVAATAGASQILDCELRALQYLMVPDTNFSMRAAFGSLPAKRDSADFQYHRASAIYLSDTSRSMYYNSLHLPVWNSWGNSDLERYAYGDPAQIWESLRYAGGADTTVSYQSNLDGHGFAIMPQGNVCNWLSGFSANRFPDKLSINADESGDYYWTHVDLARESIIFGRYGAIKDSAAHGLNLTLIRNVESVQINFDFPWGTFDSLTCNWQNFDARVEQVGVMFDRTPLVDRIVQQQGPAITWSNEGGHPNFIFSGSTRFTVYFRPEYSAARVYDPATDFRIESAYPNPFNSVINIAVASGISIESEIVIYDILGRIALRCPILLRPGIPRFNLSAAGLTSGTYFAGLKQSNQSPIRILLVR